jgi:hypothetical protein
MSPEAQRIAIAEACGFKNIRLSEAGGIYAEGSFKCGTTGIPDYLNDLNAMHEAEETLVSYIPNFILFLDNLKYISPLNGVRATAAQRAEAFLRTLKLWKP